MSFNTFLWGSVQKRKIARLKSINRTAIKPTKQCLKKKIIIMTSVQSLYIKSCKLQDHASTVSLLLMVPITGFLRTHHLHWNYSVSPIIIQVLAQVVALNTNTRLHADFENHFHENVEFSLRAWPNPNKIGSKWNCMNKEHAAAPNSISICKHTFLLRNKWCIIYKHM